MDTGNSAGSVRTYTVEVRILKKRTFRFRLLPWPSGVADLQTRSIDGVCSIPVVVREQSLTLIAV